MSSVIDTNLPLAGREQGTKRKHVTSEAGKENLVGAASSKLKTNKRVKVTEASEQVSSSSTVSDFINLKGRN